MSAAPLARARRVLRERLDERRAELEVAIVARLDSIADTSDADPAYLEGLRVSVSVALDYALEAIERGEEGVPPPPPALLAQARLAARNGVGLDTVLRRYFAGYTLLGDFLAGEAERAGLPDGAAPVQLLQGRAAIFDNLIAAVSEEYEREAASRHRSSPAQRRAERVRRLLDGEPLDTSELGYELSDHHLGLVAAGVGAAEALSDFTQALDCRLLLIQPSEETVWAWLGSRRRPDPAELKLEDTSWPTGVALAIGEPDQGLSGWRLTHRQAVAALPIALRGPKRFVRYAEVPILASVLRDDLLATSLRQLYLAPLEAERDGGETVRETLRAYFAADRHVSSAAAAVGVDRHTITSRLRTVGELLGCPVDSCATDMEVALQLDEVTEPGQSTAIPAFVC